MNAYSLRPIEGAITLVLLSLESLRQSEWHAATPQIILNSPQTIGRHGYSVS